MNEIITGALKDMLYIVIIAGLSLLIHYGLPWLGRLIKIYVIDRLVRAAEQKVKGSGMGAEKKARVMEQLEALHVKVDNFIDAMIEASVFKLNQEKEKLQKEKGIEALDDLI